MFSILNKTDLGVCVCLGGGGGGATFRLPSGAYISLVKARVQIFAAALQSIILTIQT